MMRRPPDGMRQIFAREVFDRQRAIDVRANAKWLNHMVGRSGEVVSAQYVQVIVFSLSGYGRLSG